MTDTEQAEKDRAVLVDWMDRHCFGEDGSPGWTVPPMLVDIFDRVHAEESEWTGTADV